MRILLGLFLLFIASALGFTKLRQCKTGEYFVEPECWLHCHPALSRYVGVESCCGLAGHRLSGKCENGLAMCECLVDNHVYEYLPIK
ncbi:unnamed protein product, partial [Mesorhabditis spiculigera]